MYGCRRNPETLSPASSLRARRSQLRAPPRDPSNLRTCHKYSGAILKEVEYFGNDFI
jgi:hypothetical protein